MGPTTPAPLARLITPGTLVIQTADPADLERIVSVERPAVALLFDEARPEQAHFVHDPDAGSASWERLTVSQMPDEGRVGRGRRAPTWLEEVDHLRALSAPPQGAVQRTTEDGAQRADTVEGSEPTSADRLAAWLLKQTDLEGV